MENRYNGYKNYEYWNIALWINNDFDLYQLAIETIESYTKYLKDVYNINNKKLLIANITVSFLADLEELGITKTQDDVEFTYERTLPIIEELYDSHI